MTSCGSNTAVPIETGGISLRKNVSWSFTGNVIYSACQWGMLVVLARLGTPEQVGQFALGIAITAPVVLFTNLQLRAVIATDAKGEFAFQHYLSLRLLLSFLALLVISIIVAFTDYRTETLFIIVAIGISKAIESISDIYYGYMQFQERMDIMAHSLIYRGIGSLIAVVVAMWLTGSVLAACCLFTLVWLAVLLRFDIPRVTRLRKARLLDSGSSVAEAEDVPFSLQLISSQRKSLWKLTRLSFPLGVVMLLFSLNVNLPRYFLENYRGEYELGIFAALAYLIVAGNIFVQALGQTTRPRMAKLYAAGNYKEFCKMLFSLSAIGIFIAVAGVVVAALFGEEVLWLLYGPDYSRHASSFVWIMVAGGISFAVSFIGCAMGAMRAFKEQVMPFVIVAVATLIASALLIPEHGIKGAAFALIIGNFVNLIAMIVVLVHLFKKRQRSEDE